jgi:hypothetical protein
LPVERRVAPEGLEECPERRWPHDSFLPGLW